MPPANEASIIKVLPFNFNVIITLTIEIGVFQTFVLLKLNDEFGFSIKYKETFVSPLFN